MAKKREGKRSHLRKTSICSSFLSSNSLTLWHKIHQSDRDRFLYNHAAALNGWVTYKVFTWSLRYCLFFSIIFSDSSLLRFLMSSSSFLSSAMSKTAFLQNIKNLSWHYYHEVTYFIMYVFLIKINLPLTERQSNSWLVSKHLLDVWVLKAVYKLNCSQGSLWKITPKSHKKVPKL